MPMTGFIFQDKYLVRLEKLSDQEVGRLVRALATYHARGEEQELKGRECGYYDFIKADIDEAEAAYAAKCAGNKKNRQVSLSIVNDRQRPSTTDDELPQNINIKENIKEKEIDNHGSSAGARANPFTVSDDEVVDFLERDRQIEEAARRWGLPWNEGSMIQARDWARDFTLEWLLRAIETSGKGKEQTWRYVAGILKSWKENGGPDAPRKQRASPAKVVSAQQYTQRDYTEEQLDSITQDLLEEARKLRDTG